MGDVCICPQVSADVFFYLEMSADVCSCGGLRPLEYVQQMVFDYRYSYAVFRRYKTQ